MTRKQRRLTMIGGSLAVLAVAAALVLNAMRDSIVFFSTPAVVAEKHVPAGKRFRLGGLVLRVRPARAYGPKRTARPTRTVQSIQPVLRAQSNRPMP